MNDLEARLRELAEKATPGPWVYSWTTVPAVVRADQPTMHCVTADLPGHWPVGMIVHAGEQRNEWDAANAEFIAACREGVPALLRRLSELEQENERLRSDLRNARKSHLGDARVANEMVHHFPVEIRCDHEARQDMVICDCALADLGWHPSVRRAKEAWAKHVIDVVKSARLAALSEAGGTDG